MKWEECTVSAVYLERCIVFVLLRGLNMKKITGKQLRHWAEWLKKEDCGCCHFKLLTDDNNDSWFILMGWSDGFDESDNGRWQDGSWKICTKIGYQSSNSIMQTDLNIDFLMPYDKETGDVDDTEWTLADEPNWDKLADELNNEAERVINQWAYFEIEEEEAA